MQRGAQVPVLVHQAQRLVVVRVEVKPAGLQPVGNRNRQIGQPGSASRSATPIVSSMRIELDETALVRPSNDAGVARRRISGVDDDR